MAIEKSSCNNCGSNNVYGMSRVVGYYSVIENWNDSKVAEFSDRQNGNYKLNQEKICETPETAVITVN